LLNLFLFVVKYIQLLKILQYFNHIDNKLMHKNKTKIEALLSAIPCKLDSVKTGFFKIPY